MDVIIYIRVFSYSLKGFVAVKFHCKKDSRTQRKTHITDNFQKLLSIENDCYSFHALFFTNFIIIYYTAIMENLI